MVTETVSVFIQLCFLIRSKGLCEKIPRSKAMSLFSFQPRGGKMLSYVIDPRRLELDVVTGETERKKTYKHSHSNRR